MVDHTHPAHPSHPDNHPHRAHHPHASFIRTASGLFTLFSLLIFVFVGTLTNAPFGPTLLAFLPVILLGVAGMILVNADHFDLHYIALVLLGLIILVGIALVTLHPAVDVLTTSALNIILGALFLIIIAHSHPPPEETKVIIVEKQQQAIPDLVKTVEDRCKAINFVIGRVYRVNTGAHARLRDKIKIPSEWYNELTEALAMPHGQESVVHEMVVKIKNRLELLSLPENMVFTDAEVRGLKNISREADGQTAILAVLAENDSDPVQGFHAAGLEYCDLLLEKITR